VDRRQFLESIAGFSALVPGLALLPVAAQQAFAEELHARARSAAALRTLSAAQDATLGCIAEILLPQTDTVGARGVGVNRFIDLLLTESMLDAERDKFLAGLDEIGARSQALYGAPVAHASREQQQSLVAALDARLPARSPTPAERRALAMAPMTAERGYATLKQLVVLAYFTSEPVARGLIKAPIIPGRYDGCVST
jgi:gluconate 2-dehydrogenase gamma chain